MIRTLFRTLGPEIRTFRALLSENRKRLSWVEFQVRCNSSGMAEAGKKAAATRAIDDFVKVKYVTSVQVKSHSRAACF